MEKVILVDSQDHETGQMEKMEAHLKGLLHRAISVLIFNDAGETLLQKRAAGKYHSAHLWTNTCCSHPRPGESILDAGTRRLREEMGITAALTKKTDFIYKVALDHGLTEHEFDHVLFGVCNRDPVLNTDEASDFRWMKLDDVKADAIAHPEQYTEWFKILLTKI